MDISRKFPAFPEISGKFLGNFLEISRGGYTANRERALWLWLRKTKERQHKTNNKSRKTLTLAGPGFLALVDGTRGGVRPGLLALDRTGGGNVRETSRKFPGNFREISWTFQEIPTKFPGNFQGFSWIFPGNHRKLSKTHIFRACS